MSGYETYVFILCLVTFISITALFVTMLIIIVRQEFEAIRNGLRDHMLIREYYRTGGEPPFLSNNFQKVLLAIVFVALVLFSATAYVKFSNPMVKGTGSVPRVVLSESMSYKHPMNKYLVENDLNDQFQTFDLIFTRTLPDEF